MGKICREIFFLINNIKTSVGKWNSIIVFGKHIEESMTSVVYSEFFWIVIIEAKNKHLLVCIVLLY